MTTLDRDLISKKLEMLADYSDKLKEFCVLDRNIYMADHHHYALAEHYLQQTIEIVIDISRYLVIALALKTPNDTHGLFPLLKKAGVLSNEFVERNQGMSGFRNRLVHQYETIDHGKTYEYLQEHLTDFKEFTKEVSQFLLKL